MNNPASVRKIVLSGRNLKEELKESQKEEADKPLYLDFLKRNLNECRLPIKTPK